MKLLGALLMLGFFLLCGSSTAKADTIDSYTFSVNISASYAPNNPNPFAGNTYTGSFVLDEQTGQVTSFSTNLLGSSYSNANLGDVAGFSGSVFTGLVFQLTLQTAGSAYSSGFDTGFSSYQISNGLGLDPNNYFAYLNPSHNLQGGGTPVYTLVSSVASTPEPAPWTLLMLGLCVLGLYAGVKRASWGGAQLP